MPEEENTQEETIDGIEVIEDDEFESGFGVDDASGDGDDEPKDPANADAEPDGENKDDKPGENPEDAKKEVAIDDGSKVTFKDREITLAELKDLAEKGEDYTQKTQELADQKAEFEAQLGAGALMEQITEAILESPEKAREAIAKIQDFAATTHGEKWASSTAPEFTEDELKEMDPIEKKMLADNESLRAELRRVNSELAAVVATVKDLKPILDETVQKKTFNAEVAAVKASLGLDVTPEQIAEARKTTGQKDSVAAVAVWDRNREKSKEVKEKTPEPPKTPSSKAREVKEAETADEIFEQARRRLAKES